MITCTPYQFEDDGSIPNNPNLPLLYYPRSLGEHLKNAEAALELLGSHGWTNGWVNGIFSYHHYHSNTHEVLAIVSGTAEVRLGGEQGNEFYIETGDVILIPAGVGHCCLGSSYDFKVVGAYAGGRSYDLCRGNPEERPQVLENIKKVPMPKHDPVTGKKDPLYQYWQ
ncbi:MAG: cupin domain-containing protein [Balneolaceae bacterium]|jgi:uncharacterized protein YjlB